MGEFNVDKSTGDLLETAGMPSEYPATQVMMSDGVTSVEDALDELTANNLETAVDISSYSSSNMYTTPSDGYVNIETSSNDAYVLLVLYGANGQNFIYNSVSYTNGHNARSSFFVKKGMKLYLASKVGTFSRTVFVHLQ